MNGIPARALPLAARAPGKCILFGEHAVVHGRPELVLAIDLYTQVAIRTSSELRLNGSPESARRHAYLQQAVAQLWPNGAPIDVAAVSRIPRASGLGSSAAFVSSLAAGLGAANGGCERASLAQASFTIERRAQGVGSPGDTSAAVAGGYVALNASALGGRPVLWEVGAGSERWTVRRIADPAWVWVVAFTGIPKETGATVRAVGERLARPDGPALLDRFREVAESGIRALERGDREETAQLLQRNQELLREIGVSHPRLEALLDAARPASLGGKLTGAGAGGSVVVLPRPGLETDLVRRLARAGGVPYAVRPAVTGTELV